MKILFYILGYLIINFSYASIEVRLEPNPAELNQEVKLILKQYGKKRTGGVPDISVLNKDFSIVGTQQSMSYQITNGNVEHENIWTIILRPNHVGTFQIPSLNIGGENTPPQILKVINQNKTYVDRRSDKDLPNVFMEWGIEPKQPVLNEQIRLKIKIYHALPLLDAKLIPPHVSNGLLFSLNDASHDITIRDGKKYEIETYEYFIYPQKKGKLVIQSPVLDALEYNLTPMPIHVTLPSLFVSVNYQNDLIPVKELNYKELTPRQGQVRISLGDTFTRKILLIATGIPKNLLPDIKPDCGKECKVYSHVRSSFNKIINKQLYSAKTFEFTYLPYKEGDFLIPSIKINWFNTLSRKKEILTIPQMNIVVKKENFNSIDNDNSKEFMQKTKTVGDVHLPTWLSILTGLGLGILLMVLYRFISWSSLKKRVKEIELKDHHLKMACDKNDPKQVRRALLAWGKKKFKGYKIIELNDLLPLIFDPKLRQEIEALIKVIYANHHKQDDWSGQSFWVTFKHRKEEKRKKNIIDKNYNRLNPD